MYRDIVTALPPAIPLLFCGHTLDSSGLTLDDWLNVGEAVRKKRLRFAVERPSHFQVMFDSAIHRRKDSAVAVPAVKKDVRSEEILTAAIWALMHGHAMFAMDDSFTNMEFKTHPDTLVHDSFELLANVPALSR
jgi:hypothetical protein